MTTATPSEPLPSLEHRIRESIAAKKALIAEQAAEMPEKAHKKQP